MLDELIHTQETLAQMASSNMPECLKSVVDSYCKRLNSNIKHCMERKSIFTLLTAYPYYCPRS